MTSIHTQAFDTSRDQTVFEGLLSGEGVLGFVALGEAPLGLVHCRAVAGESEVLTIAVPTAARRTGVARALMVAALREAAKAGALEVFLEVEARNAAAVGLYEGPGYERGGLRRAYYDRDPAGRADALVMRLDLMAKGSYT